MSPISAPCRAWRTTSTSSPMKLTSTQASFATSFKVAIVIPPQTFLFYRLCNRLYVFYIITENIKIRKPKLSTGHMCIIAKISSFKCVIVTVCARICSRYAIPCRAGQIYWRFFSDMIIYSHQEHKRLHGSIRSRRRAADEERAEQPNTEKIKLLKL